MNQLFPVEISVFCLFLELLFLKLVSNMFCVSMLLCALICLVVMQSHGKAGTNRAPQGALRKSGRGWAAGVSSLLLEDPLSILTLIFDIARFRFCGVLSFSEQG